MAFHLGNHAIDEIIYAIASDFDDKMLYTLDQLSSASISVTSESNEITDKKGNIIRRTFRSKSAEFTATNALLHPAIMAAASGSGIEVATESVAIEMPRILSIAAGATIDAGDAKEGTIHVMGMFGNGANDVELTQSTAAVAGESFAYVDGKITVPDAGDDLPTYYIIRYDRDRNTGIKISNYADKFPNTVHLNLLCSYVDPCSAELKSCIVYIPSFMANPDITINLDSENQEIDYAGTIQIDYCSKGGQKLLYVVYYPDENVTVVGTGEDSDTPTP